MITFVTWLWKPEGEYHAQYTEEHVNTLYRMLNRHHLSPHRVICFTDMPLQGVEPGVHVITRSNPFPELRNPFGEGTPTCYRRLELFGPLGTQLAGGGQIVCIDLDCVITGDLTPLFDRSEDFVIWRSFARQTQYNGSLWMMKPGARPKVWEKFIENPERAIDRARGAGFYGSDQAWLNYILGPKERCYGEHSGVYSFRRHIFRQGELPKDARIVFFEGLYSPWATELQQKYPWILQHYY